MEIQIIRKIWCYDDISGNILELIKKKMGNYLTSLLRWKTWEQTRHI